MNAPDGRIEEAARAAGPLHLGGWRVVVIEADATPRTHDFERLEQAAQYADDCASESNVPAPLAWVFDHTFSAVHRGRHYGSS